MEGEFADVVIIGAGHAGVETAVALRHSKFAGRIVLLSAEDVLPYQRPPLSKDYIKSGIGGTSPALKPESFFSQARIELRLGSKAVDIDRASHHIHLSDGTVLGYGHLVLATGARNRMPPVAGLDHPDTLALRTFVDAVRFKTALAGARRVAIVGGGFIGLEAASTLRGLAIEVDVVETAPRLMRRSVSETLSAWFLEHHSQSGTRFHLNAVLQSVEHCGDVFLRLADGTTIVADAVVLAAGVEPEADLGLRSGLAVDNGIVVDEQLLTDDPNISAIGDCAAFPLAGSGGRVRLESVQNAVDQARTVALRITGSPQSYDVPPWFWSIQGSARLQIAGLLRPGLREIARHGIDATRFSVFHFDGDGLVAVESVNSPADHMAARTFLRRGGLTAAQVSDSTLDLKTLALA